MHVCTLASRGQIFAHLQLVIDAKAYFFQSFFVTEQASALYQASAKWRNLFKQPKLITLTKRSFHQYKYALHTAFKHLTLQFHFSTHLHSSIKYQLQYYSIYITKILIYRNEK